MIKKRKNIMAFCLLFCFLVGMFMQSAIVLAGTNENNSQIKNHLLYSSHIQTIGWQKEVTQGEMSGTSGQALRLEAIKIALSNSEYEGNIRYRTHVQTYGWQNWVQNGEISGTSGQAKRLEAIQIELTGEMAEHYDVYYRVHAQTYGWLGWAKNGKSAGAAGYAKRLEGIEIVLVEKDGAAPGEMEGCFKHPLVQYNVHCQTYGWLNNADDGKSAGTVGQAKRLEGIHISLNNPEYSGTIQYRTYVQTYGWQPWKTDGEMSGTSGQAKRLEAIQIRLTGEMEKQYDVYYRVHAQTYGWLGWARNGRIAGTAGQAKRLEAIQIKLVSKGLDAPGDTDNTFKCSHQWKTTHRNIRDGYACNQCYTDVTGWEDMYACHGAWHTHQWCDFPMTDECSICGKKQHRHNWGWVKPTYWTGTNNVRTPGYYFCIDCCSFSKDGQDIDNSIQKDCNMWVTPYDFTGKGYTFVVQWKDTPTDDMPIESVNIKCLSSMSVGDTYQCSATFTPANPTGDKKVTWSSSNPSVVAVDQNGKVKALSNGTATIKAETANYCKATRFIRVTPENIGKVTAARLYVNNQDITDSMVTLEKNKEYDVTLVTSSEEAVYEVKYSTSNSDCLYFSGSILCGNISTWSWENALLFTKPITTIKTRSSSDSAIITANIYDINGNKTVISGTILLE